MGQTVYKAKEDPTYQKVNIDIEHWEERPNPNGKDGNPDDVFTQVLNLDRARIVVD